MRFGYVRINPTEENHESLLQQFQTSRDLQQVYWDKVSVKEKKRPEYDKMMNHLKAGDEIVLPEFARFSKTLIELVKTIEELDSCGITVISEKEDFNSGTENGKFKLKVLKSAVEFEKTILKQRQIEGIAIAKASGKYKGYNEKVLPNDFEDFRDLYYMKEITVSDIAEHYRVSRPTVYKWMKQVDDESEEQIGLSENTEQDKETELISMPIIPDDPSIYDEPEVIIERRTVESEPSKVLKTKSQKNNIPPHLLKRKKGPPEDFKAYRKMYQKGILTISDIAIANKVTSQTVRRWLSLTDDKKKAKKIKNQESTVEN